MVALVWIINIILVIACAGLIVCVLMQDSKSGGMGEAFGGGSTDSFYAKNKSKTGEARLAMLTKVLAVLIAVLSIAMVFITKNL